MTAIVFAGRTGAAFAAQIGTQKVNEEVNAISTSDSTRSNSWSAAPARGDPGRAAARVMADIVGLFGGALVMTTFDIVSCSSSTNCSEPSTRGTFVLGIVKAAVFGLTIAAVGCHRGLATGAGATSVGLSATSAVVTSIVLVVVIDGIFRLAS